MSKHYVRFKRNKKVIQKVENICNHLNRTNWKESLITMLNESKRMLCNKYPNNNMQYDYEDTKKLINGTDSKFQAVWYYYYFKINVELDIIINDLN